MRVHSPDGCTYLRPRACGPFDTESGSRLHTFDSFYHRLLANRPRRRQTLSLDPFVHHLGMLVPTKPLKSISPAIRALRQSCLRPRFQCLGYAGHATSLRGLSTVSDLRSHRITPWIKYGVSILVGGGLLYAFDVSRRPELHDLIISPAFIPPPGKQAPVFVTPSPPDITLFEKITDLLRKYMFSPLRTGLRFLHLLFIFSPVIIASPMLFIGVSEPQYGGERRGAIWWYGLLTKSMQRAGPTFIKVSVCLISLLEGV